MKKLNFREKENKDVVIIIYPAYLTITLAVILMISVTYLNY